MAAFCPIYDFKILLERAVLLPDNLLSDVPLSARVQFLELEPLEVAPGAKQQTLQQGVVFQGFPERHTPPFYSSADSMVRSMQRQPVVVTLYQQHPAAELPVVLGSASVSVSEAFGAMLERARRCAARHPLSAVVRGEYPVCDVEDPQRQLGTLALSARLRCYDGDALEQIKSAARAQKAEWARLDASAWRGSSRCTDERVVTTATPVCSKCQLPKRPEVLKRGDLLKASQDTIPEERLDNPPWTLGPNLPKLCEDLGEPDAVAKHAIAIGDQGTAWEDVHGEVEETCGASAPLRPDLEGEFGPKRTTARVDRAVGQDASGGDSAAKTAADKTVPSATPSEPGPTGTVPGVIDTPETRAPGGAGNPSTNVQQSLLTSLAAPKVAEGQSSNHTAAAGAVPAKRRSATKASAPRRRVSDDAVKANKQTPEETQDAAAWGLGTHREGQRHKRARRDSDMSVGLIVGAGASLSLRQVKQGYRLVLASDSAALRDTEWQTSRRHSTSVKHGHHVPMLLEMNFNIPLPRYGHQDCSHKPTAVPGNQGWLWNHESSKYQPRTGWHPGAIPRTLGLHSTQS